MPDLIPNQNLGAMFGSSVGSGLGGGLGAGLQALAEHKLQELHGAKFWKSLGLDDETARSFAAAPEKLQRVLLDRLEGANVGSQGQQQQSQMGQQLMQQPNQNDLSHLAAQPEELGQLGQSIQQQMQQQGQPNQIQMLQMLGMLPQEQGVNPFMQQPQQMQKQQPSQNQLAQLQQMLQQQPQQPGKVTLGANPAERRHREMLKEQQLKRASKENAEAFKATSSYREKVNNQAEEYENNLFRIKEAKALEKEGNLNSQAYLTFLNAAGLEGVEGLINGDTSAYNKIMADFQKGAKDVYGGRITNQELEQFLKTIPNLYMSPSGRAKIFSMMEYWNRGGIEKQKIMTQIMKENGGIPPYDLHEQVIKRSKPRMDQLANKFKEDLKEALTLSQKQQGSSKLGTAAAHAAGKLVRNIPQGLAGAGLGAYGGARIGALGGPIGALGGGVLGGLAGLGGASLKRSKS